MNLAFDSALPAGRKFVLLALCDRAGEDGGQCYPSVKWICRRCSMSERTVQGHLADLERDGVVAREKKHGHRNTYTVFEDRIRDWQPTPAESAPPQNLRVSPPQNLQDTPAESAPNPSDNHQTATDIPDLAGLNPKKLGSVTLRRYLQVCIGLGVEAVADDDPVFAYAQAIQLPEDFLRLAWEVFHAKYINTDKKQSRWPQKFRNAVEGNWLKLWYEAEGSWHLTTAGKQAKLAYGKAIGQAA